jgi:hypothetical protein
MQRVARRRLVSSFARVVQSTSRQRRMTYCSWRRSHDRDGGDMRLTPLLILCFACNPSNTHDACVDIAQNWCQRVFALEAHGCAAAPAFIAQQGFATEHQCEQSFMLFGGTCATRSTNQCAPDDYSGGRASACASAAANVTCDALEFLDGDACQDICCVGGGLWAADAHQCCSGSATAETQMETGCNGQPITVTRLVCD